MAQACAPASLRYTTTATNPSPRSLAGGRSCARSMAAGTRRAWKRGCSSLASPSEGRGPGRPTDPSAVHHPQVPMREATVQKLARLAEGARSPVTPCDWLKEGHVPRPEESEEAPSIAVIVLDQPFRALDVRHAERWRVPLDRGSQAVSHIAQQHRFGER